MTQSKSQIPRPKFQTNSKSQITKSDNGKTILKRALLASLSAACLVLSFPGFNLYMLAWVGLVPLMFAIDGLKPAGAFLVSYLCGFLFFLGTIYWLIHVTLPGMIIVVMYLALYFGFV